MQMDVIKRNFVKLMCIGAFGEQQTIEPMSQFKWKVLYKVAAVHHVERVMDKALGKTFQPPLLPIPDAGMARINNRLLNRRLQKIRESEPSDPDASVETLNMLDIIVQTAEAFLTYGLQMGYVLRTGIYLRSDGDKIDYIKLERWLHRLGMYRMAQLIGSILVGTLHFEQDEIPFLSRIEKGARSLAAGAIDKPIAIKAEEWKMRQFDNGLVGNNNRAMMQVARNCMRYFAYAPVESVSCFFARFTDSLANLEE